MIKWFCDICQQEIEDPLNPEYINIHCEGRNRDEEGWDIPTKWPNYVVTKVAQKS